MVEIEAKPIIRLSAASRYLHPSCGRDCIHVLATSHRPNVGRMALSLDGDSRSGTLDLGKIGFRQFDIRSPKIFFKAMQFRCARDGNDPGFLREQPSNRHLTSLMIAPSG